MALATRAAGMAHEAPTTRLVERPFVSEDAFGLWPFHLHGLIRSTIRTADDCTDDRWSPRDWAQAAQRALDALGEQLNTSFTRGRLLLIGCMRQGLRLARDHRLELDWLAGAAWSYVSDSVWEPLAPPAPQESATTGLETAADALVETLSAIGRRQHEHRERTVDRLTAVVNTGLLPTDLHEMAVYYRAKAQRDLGRSDDSRRGMQLVADGGGRLAPAARRGLAHLARLAGDFPTALATAQTLGWEGRHHRVEGDVWWVQGEMDRAAAAYEAARTEAEQHGITGERATSQAQRAFVLAFTDPDLADDELELAHQLLAGLDLRATDLTTQIAALLRDAVAQIFPSGPGVTACHPVPGAAGAPGAPRFGRTGRGFSGAGGEHAFQGRAFGGVDGEAVHVLHGGPGAAVGAVVAGQRRLPARGVFIALGPVGASRDGHEL